VQYRPIRSRCAGCRVWKRKWHRLLDCEKQVF